jgi:hypothetical protein
MGRIGRQRGFNYFAEREQMELRERNGKRERERNRMVEVFRRSMGR